MSGLAERGKQAAQRDKHLVEPDTLQSWIEEGRTDLRVVDMRGVVRTSLVAEGVQAAVYTGARSDYDQGHIPCAMYLDWTRDIADETDPIPAQAAPPEKVKRVFESLGIGDGDLIVAYDAHPASQFSTRLWWLMRYYGHDTARVLNGGWQRWVREGRPISTAIPDYAAARFSPRVVPEWRATADDVAGLLGDESAVIVDARDADQYTGRIRRGTRGGHIPGAVHVPREALFGPDGAFKDTEALKDTLTAHGVPAGKRVVAYCNGGVAATSVLFALSMCGAARLTNYDGSWNEWAERPDLPVETYSTSR